MATSSAAFAINGGASGAKASVAVAGAVSATLSSIANVRSVVWTISSTDETTSAASYTLIQSGSVGQTVTCTALTAGTAAILQATINGGQDSQTGQINFNTTRATGKFFVPATSGFEVGCAGENYESDPTFGSTGIINNAVRSATAAGAVPATPNTLVQRDSSGNGTFGIVKGTRFVSTNANVAASGVIALANNAIVVAVRNAANTADIQVLTVDGSDNVLLGDSTNGASVQLIAKAAGTVSAALGGTTRWSANATGLGLYAASPVAQPSRVGQLTDSTAGTPGSTLASVVGTTYSTDIATIRNWAASLAQRINALELALHNLGVTA